MFRQTAAVLAMLAFAPAPASADEAFEACIAGGQDNTSCAQAWSKRETAAIADAWNQINDLTEGSVKASLDTEQAAWSAFEKTACLFMLDEAFGPGGQKGSFERCKAEVLADRAAELRNHLKLIDN